MTSGSSDHAIVAFPASDLCEMYLHVLSTRHVRLAASMFSKMVFRVRFSVDCTPQLYICKLSFASNCSG